MICSVKKRKIHFGILSDLRIQSWIFFKKRALVSVSRFRKIISHSNLRTMASRAKRQRFDTSDEALEILFEHGGMDSGEESELDRKLENCSRLSTKTEKD